MKLLITVLLFWASAYSATFSEEPSHSKIKKIAIVESNNERLDDRVHTIPMVEHITDSALVALKAYVSPRIAINAKSDPDVFFTIMEWVSLQWKHDGFNEPPANASSLDILKLAATGSKFRCIEYGKVVSDVLLSYGYISRIIGMNSKDVAYGALGMGHAASEVWSNTLQKWIYIDPQFCLYAMHNKQYLNYYDMYQLRKQGKYNEIEFEVGDSYLKNNGLKKAEVLAEYRKFLSNYFGYLMTPYYRESSKSLISLPLEAKEQFLTSQGLSSFPLIFTQNPRDLYFSINRTLIVFNYRELSPALSQIIQDFKLQSNEDYLNNMYLFAAKPDYTLTLQNNMPWFDHYEYKNDKGSWVKLAGNTLDWKAVEGLNTLSVRSINTAGIPGVVTTVVVKYQ